MVIEGRKHGAADKALDNGSAVGQLKTFQTTFTLVIVLPDESVDVIPRVCSDSS